ncbi:MAG: filamentous hemagglutinin family protein [Proteobacteria bacterium]|nr:filamentous hemagglutinin family protein [Pseudomonadota bacterium]
MSKNEILIKRKTVGVLTTLCFIAAHIVMPCFIYAQTAMPGFYGRSAGKLTPPPATALPVLKNNGDGISYVEEGEDNSLVVHQNSEKAVASWQSFDIGEDASVHFDQKGNPDWAALNRIYDLNPSQIFGKLTADGRIYLLNQNGIVFGPDSQINAHAFTASALNLEDTDFFQNQLKYYIDPDESDTSQIYVSNHGNIKAGDGGSVFLIGPNVENSGTISAPTGQIGLIAGTDVELVTPQMIDPEDIRVAKYVNIYQTSGSAINFNTGRLTSVSGTIGMYGKVVNQDGLIRSVSAVKREGQIELEAAHEIVTGKESITECPVSSSAEVVNESFDVQTGQISMTVVGDDEEGADRIIHQGQINSPGGTVTLSANDRIYLEKESSIDVSGTWVDEDMSVNQVSSQLNSMELRDDFGQKDNSVLQGEEITFSSQEGSAIGDVSGALNTRELSAAENSTKGGTIQFSSNNGDVIIRDGSFLDISGGGFKFDAGAIETTQLVCGTSIYDIADAPSWIEYDKVLGNFEKTYHGFGVVETYKGQYYGGPVPMYNYISGYIEGSDAGTLRIQARNVILDGRVDGSTVIGPYQNYLGENEPEDELGNQMASGRKVPNSGTLIIGYLDDTPELTERDYVTDRIILQKQVDKLPDDFDQDASPDYYPEADSDPQSTDSLYTTYMSSDDLNEMNLSEILFYTNSSFTVENDVDLELDAGGTFRCYASSIDDNGSITIPSGVVDLTSSSSFLTGMMSIATRIFLNSGSIIDVSGEQVDNSFLDISDDDVYVFGREDGGGVQIKNKNTDGEIVVLKDALIDASGGYTIHTNGAITGGDAGSIKLSGTTLILDGDLDGQTLLGNKGGTIDILTSDIRVVPWRAFLPDDFRFSDDIPAGFDSTFYLAEDQLKNSGMTTISLTSENDIVLEEGVTLEPSYTRIREPAPGTDRMADETIEPYNTYATSYIDDIYMDISPEVAGPTKVSLKAGKELDLDLGGTANNFARISITEGAKIETAPEGTITLSGPDIQVDGTLITRSGTVSLVSSGLASVSSLEKNKLTLGKSAIVDVSGFNRLSEDSLFDGLPADITPVNGGDIVLDATGDLIIEDGATLNLSGSEIISDYRKNDNSVYTVVDVASDPGTLSLSFGSYLNPIADDQGNVIDHGYLDGVDILAENNLDGRVENGRPNGAALDLDYQKNKNIAGGPGLAIGQEDLDMSELVDAGFEDITIRTNTHIDFSEPLDIELGEKLTLDAPEIRATALLDNIDANSEVNEIISDNTVSARQNDGVEDISINAPWIVLTNTYDESEAIPNYDSNAMPEALDLFLRLDADFIDIEGSIVLSGLENITLSADYDISLTDALYTKGGENIILGGLNTTTGSLNMSAARIYPKTDADFVIHASGDIEISKSGFDYNGALVSAGGSLTIEGQNIFHKGVLAAPMGRISLSTLSGTDGQIVLGNESVISTSVTGDIDPKAFKVNYGELKDGNWLLIDESETTAVTETPEKSVTIKAGTVMMDDGAAIDVSGGGSIFAYEFLPSLSGTKNPLDGKYVILADHSVSLPGEAIYLKGGYGLEEGTYSLLPEEYAFMDNALIVTRVDTDVYANELANSEEGYQVIPGYYTQSGTGIVSTELTGFSIQKASDVINNQGYFEQETLTSGDGGVATIASSTTILGGDIKASGMEVNEGEVPFQGGTLNLSGREVTIGSNVQEITDLTGRLILDTTTFSGETLKELNIGDTSGTDSVTVQANSGLISGSITLSAQNKITLEDNASVQAIDGSVSLISPEGKIITALNSTVQATDKIIVNSSEIGLKGNLKADSGTLELITTNMILGQGNIPDDLENTMVVGEDLWHTFSSYDTLILNGRDTIFFSGDVDIKGVNNILIDTPLIGTVSSGSNQVVSFTATKDLRLSNTGNPSIPDTGQESSGNGTFTLSGANVALGNGETRVEGFEGTAIRSRDAITCIGDGGLSANGNLSLESTFITTTYYQDDSAGFQVSDFFIQAANDHQLTIDKAVSGATAGSDPADGDAFGTGIGGDLALEAGSIVHKGTIDVASANISFTASQNIELTKSAEIISKGTDLSPGGTIALESKEGMVSLGEDTRLTVSAGEQGDAGIIELICPKGDVSILGNLEGQAQVNPDTETSGLSGSLYMDSNRIDDLEKLYALNKDHGFNHELEIRARTGNLDILEDKGFAADHIKLTADGGSIQIAGTLDASTDSGGGVVEVYAGQDLNLSTAKINARSISSESAEGGNVILGSANGHLSFEDGAKIDVSPSGDGKKGAVTFRAPETAQGADMTLSGTVVGASAIDAYALSTYPDFNVETVKSKTDAFMARASFSGVNMNYEECDPDAFHLRPFIDVQLENDYTLDADLNLDSLFSYAGELIFRSGGNLNLNASISDNKPVGTVSWDISLIAGADLGSADFHNVNGQDESQNGNLSIADSKSIYTTGGDLFFASGSDTTVGTPAAPESRFTSGSPFTLGTYSGAITGKINKDLILEGGIIQSATGDVRIMSRGDIALNRVSGANSSYYYGTVRTLGEPSDTAAADEYWNYGNGGDLFISAGGNISERSINSLTGLYDYRFLRIPNAWDKVTEIGRGEDKKVYWSASYDGSNTTKGIAALAGGDMTIYTGRDILTQCGNFGEGDVDIYAGGDVDGRFLIRKSGSSHINAMGSVGTQSSYQLPVEISDTDLTLSAQGSIEIGSIYNTSFVRKGISSPTDWLVDYSKDAKATLISTRGDVFLTGNSELIDGFSADLINLLPPYVEIRAGNDIRFDGRFYLAPDMNGGLVLNAGGSIDGSTGSKEESRSIISMLDIDPNKIYGSHNNIEFRINSITDLFGEERIKSLHDVNAAYRNSSKSVYMTAASDIEDLRLYVYTAADIRAGNDIVDMYYWGQNSDSEDTTLIQAGRDIVMNTSIVKDDDDIMGIVVGGPGEILVSAGNAIDLGQSEGIQSVANLYNPTLEPLGSTTIVAAGFLKPDLTTKAATTFFQQIQDEGRQYSDLLASGEIDNADQKKKDIRENIISPFFNGTETGDGVINMVDSQISAKGENSDLFVFADGKETGDINVGRTTIKDKDAVETKNSGIYTSSGGAINLFAKNDVNVNEARVMTFRGGDITVWSDQGDINAGRGSKTAINVEPPKVIIDQKTGDVSITFEPPSVGSGIRTLTYDPDGVEGPLLEPEAGDVYLFAPEGIIDAGEAGIAGKNVILAATEVVNAGNIDIVGGTGVGVPTSGESMSALGSLSGEGGLSSTKEMMDQGSELADARDKMEESQKSLGDTIKPKWLKVDFVGYDKDSDDKEDNDRENRKEEQ